MIDALTVTLARWRDRLRLLRLDRADVRGYPWTVEYDDLAGYGAVLCGDEATARRLAERASKSGRRVRVVATTLHHVRTSVGTDQSVILDDAQEDADAR